MLGWTWRRTHAIFGIQMAEWGNLSILWVQWHDLQLTRLRAEMRRQPRLF